MKQALIIIALVTGFSDTVRANDFEPVLRLAQSAGGIVSFERRNQSWRITSLDFGSYADLTDRHLIRVEQLNTLERLTISMTVKLTVTGCQHLAAMTQLRQLSCWGLDETALESLSNLPRLDSLKFVDQDTRPTDTVLARLKTFRNLTSLSLARTVIDDGAVPLIASLDSLQELDLALDFKITDSGIARLGALKNLRSLKVYNFGQKSAMALRQLPHLENLAIENCVSDTIDLSEFTSLESLSLDNDEGHEAALKMPPKLQRLEVGPFWVAKVGRIKAESLPKSVNTVLVQLPIWFADGDLKPPGRDLSWLSALPSLRDLTLSGTGAMVDDVKAILVIEGLRSLKLEGQGVAATDEHLKFIAQLKNLETLSVRHCQQFACSISGGVTDAGLTMLGDLKKLRRLELCGLRQSK